MKTFQEFINESVRDLLKGKSEEEIINAIKYLPDYRKIIYILKYDLPKEYLPKNIKKIIIDNIRSHLRTYFRGEIKYIEYLNFENFELPVPKKGQHLIKSFNVNGLNIEVYHKIGKMQFKSFKPNYIIPYEDLSPHILLKIADFIGCNNWDESVIWHDDEGIVDEKGEIDVELDDLWEEEEKIDEGLINRIKPFQEFINESVRDLLKGKSEEEIEKGLQELSPYEKILYIYKYNLSPKYFPENVKETIINRISKDLTDKEWFMLGNLNFGFLELNDNSRKKHLIKGFNYKGVIIDKNLNMFQILYKRFDYYIIPYEDLSPHILLKIADFIGCNK